MIDKSIKIARKHLSHPIHRWNALTMREDLERLLSEIEVLLLLNNIDELESEATEHKHAYIDSAGRGK